MKTRGLAAEMIAKISKIARNCESSVSPAHEGWESKSTAHKRRRCDTSYTATDNGTVYSRSFNGDPKEFFLSQFDLVHACLLWIESEGWISDSISVDL